MWCTQRGRFRVSRDWPMYSCVYMYFACVCAFVCTCVFVCVYVSMSICSCVSVSVFASVCVCVCACVCVCMCMCMCACVYACVRAPMTHVSRTSSRNQSRIYMNESCPIYERVIMPLSGILSCMWGITLLMKDASLFIWKRHDSLYERGLTFYMPLSYKESCLFHIKSHSFFT